MIRVLKSCSFRKIRLTMHFDRIVVRGDLLFSEFSVTLSPPLNKLCISNENIGHGSAKYSQSKTSCRAQIKSNRTHHTAESSPRHLHVAKKAGKNKKLPRLERHKLKVQHFQRRLATQLNPRSSRTLAEATLTALAWTQYHT